MDLKVTRFGRATTYKFALEFRHLQEHKTKVVPVNY